MLVRALGLMAIAGSVAGVLAGTPTDGVTADTIVIGMEGPSQSISLDEENLGMRLVMRQVNDGGGIHGRRLVERSYSRGTTAPVEQAFVNAKRLVEEDRVFLLFNFGGPNAVTLGPYAMAQHVPYMFPHTALLTLDGARYIFTSYPRYDGESRVMFRYLSQSRGLKRIAIIHDANVYGQFFLDRLQRHAEAFGYTFAGSQAVASADPADLTNELRTLRDARPDAVVLALYPAQAKKVMEAKARLDWRTVSMVSVGPLTEEQYLNVPGGYAEGTLGFCYYPDPNAGGGPGIVEYRAQMAKYFPGHELNRYSLYGYAFGKLVVEGLRRAGPSLTRETFIDAMESLHEWDTGGVMPPVSFSPGDHHAQTAGFICELKDAKFQPLTGWIEPE